MTLRLCFYNDCLVCERLNRHLKQHRCLVYGLNGLLVMVKLISVGYVRDSLTSNESGVPNCKKRHRGSCWFGRVQNLCNRCIAQFVHKRTKTLLTDTVRFYISRRKLDQLGFLNLGRPRSTRVDRTPQLEWRREEIALQLPRSLTSWMHKWMQK